MEQNCDNCEWKNAPCENCNCKTFRDNAGFGSVGCNDYWTPAKPWEDRWVVPKGCSGYFSNDHEYLFGYAHGWPSVWSLLNGNCTMTSYGSGAPNLIPKTPSIEETEEFKAFAATYNKYARTTQLVKRYLELQKIFKMELKQA